VAERKPVLLTVSGRIPHDLDEQVACGRRPRADYRVIADVCDADVVDVTSALNESGRLGRMLFRAGGAGLLLAWYAFRRRGRYEVVLTDGEQVGIPLAMLTRMLGRRGGAHVMIVHVLSVRKKSMVMRVARLASQVDRYIVYASSQADFVERELRVPAERVALSTFMVDTDFFSRAHARAERRRLICSAGLERRDYPTMMDAVDGLDVEVVIAAASPWSKQRSSVDDRSIPANVEIRSLDLFDLRRLYAESAFVVMPLVDTKFQAGITTMLEAMSMELAVICTRTTGQTDTIVDGENGLYVPPGDARALRDAIVRLLDNEPEAARLGAAARRWVTANADIEIYARFVGDVVDQVRRA
jgi:glycosyltransferase involved in cell wall biosynthesis